MIFHREHEIKSVRKSHQCMACQTEIEIGMPALYLACHDNSADLPFFGHFHRECREAEIALNETLGWQSGDGWSALHDIESEDLDWLEHCHPIAFARLTAARTLPPIREHERV